MWEPGCEGYSGFFFVSVLNQWAKDGFNSDITPETVADLIPEWFKDIRGIASVQYSPKSNLFQFYVEPIYCQRRELYHGLWRFVAHKFVNLGMALAPNSKPETASYQKGQKVYDVQPPDVYEQPA